MTLMTRERTTQTENGQERQLVVACPQRVDPVPIKECARCELCEGLELDGRVGVRCAVEPTDAVDGVPPAYAPVSTIMTSPVVAVQNDASAENVQWLLVDRGIGAVPVLDRSGRPVGILAKTDLLRDRDEPMVSVRLDEREAPPEPGSSVREAGGLRAADLMTPIVYGVLESTSIAATAALMAKQRVHHIVVVGEEGKVVGIVSALDIARWVAARERFAPQ
jgi:CBS domain-containing protein